MYKTLSVLLVATLTLSACNSWRNSRANPSNWFGSSSPAPVETSASDADALIPQTNNDGNGFFSRPEAEDTSVPITRIDELRIDPTSTGAIIYAAGTAQRQGAYDARLVLESSEENTKNGVLEYTFRVNYPANATPAGAERTRMVSEAITVSSQDLQNIRLVRVIGQQNALESRRR